MKAGEGSLHGFTSQLASRFYALRGLYRGEQVLCAGEKLQFLNGRHDILGGKPLDYYTFAGYPLLFKYFSYRDYCRDHPEYVSVDSESEVHANISWN